MKKIAKYLIVMVLFSAMGRQDGEGQAIFFGQNFSSGCTPPTNETYRWVPNSGCSTSVACATDVVASNNASQTTSGDLPTYSATGGPNNQPYLSFNGTSDYLTFSTTIPTTACTGTGCTFWVVWYIASTGATKPWFGYSGGGNNFQGYYFQSANVQRLANTFANAGGGYTGPWSGTDTYSATTWYTTAVTMTSGGTWQTYKCSGGTCATDGSGGTGAGWGTISFATNALGIIAGQSATDYWSGRMAEWGYYAGSSITGLAAWSKCQYGI